MAALIAWAAHHWRHDRLIYVTVDRRAGVQLYWMHTTENRKSKERKS